MAEGAVHDEVSLRGFLRGRLLTAGPTEAWFTAAAARVGAEPGSTARLGDLEAAYEARVPSAAQRASGRTLGRGLRRVATGLWPEASALKVEQYPIVLGAVAVLAGLAPLDGARIAVHNLVTGAATAAPKLFAIDMVDALRAAASISVDAERAVDAASTPAPPPARSAPLTERRAERHARWDVRLFAS